MRMRTPNRGISWKRLCGKARSVCLWGRGEIWRYKNKEVEETRNIRPVQSLISAVAKAPPARDFRKRLLDDSAVFGPHPYLIAAKILCPASR